MSASALCAKENSSIKFINNPNTGNIFFACGNVTGYVSPKIRENLDSVTINELQFAEVSIDGKEPVPCLMMRGTDNVVKTLGENLTR
jgi:hypothetical protein